MKSKMIQLIAVSFLILTGIHLLQQNYDISFTSAAQANGATATTSIGVTIIHNFYGMNISEPTAAIKVQEVNSLSMLKHTSDFIPGLVQGGHADQNSVVLFKGPQVDFIETTANGGVGFFGGVILSQENNTAATTYYASNVNFTNSSLSSKNRFQSVAKKDSEDSATKAATNCHANSITSTAQLNQDDSNSACNFAIAVALNGDNNSTQPVVNMLFTTTM